MPEPRVAASYVHLLYEYLEGAGLDARAVLGPEPPADDHFVPLARWQHLLALAAQADPRPGLPLRIARHISPRHFGVVGYAALSSKTLAQALMRLERYHASVYDVNLASIRWLPQGVQIEWGVERGRPGALVDETAIASVVHLARDMTGENWPLDEVWFVNPPPPDLGLYESFFQAPVRFAQPVTRLSFPARYLQLPLRESDPGLLALLDRQADSLLAELGDVPPAVQAWRRTLVTLIREGRTSLDALARAHHTSTRSLQRKLAEHGRTFQRLLDETRRHLAIDYLRRPDLDIAEIALLLGYAEQSSFTRAFRSWTGEAPAQWRRRERAGRSSPDDAARPRLRPQAGARSAREAAGLLRPPAAAAWAPLPSTVQPPTLPPACAAPAPDDKPRA